MKTIATRLLTSNRLEPSSYNLINCGWLVHQEKNMYQNYSTLESGSPRWTVELDYKKYNWNCMNEDGMTARFDSVDELGLAKHIYIYIFTEFSNNWSLCAHQFGPPVVRWQKKSSNYMMKWLFQSGLNNQAISCLKLHPYLAFLSVNKSASETWVYVPEVWRVGLLYIAHAGNSGSEFRIRSRSRFCKLEWKKIFGGGG